MTRPFEVRPMRESDYAGWRPLWDAYNAFYGRVGATALPEAVSKATWQRFFDAAEPLHALVAEYRGEVAGLAHYLFHRSTSRLAHVCYLQDLYTKDTLRGQGAGRQMIEAVYEAARNAGSSRVYWITQATNVAARSVYDRLAQNLGFIVYSHEL